MKLKLMISAFTVIFLFFFSREQSPYTNPMEGIIDVTSYHLKITMNEQDSSIIASNEIRFHDLKAIRTIPFNLVGMIVDSCMFNNRQVKYDIKNNSVMVSTPTLFQAGESYAVTLYYHGRPSGGLYIGKNKYGHFCAFGDNWPNRARYWIPCIDYPSDKARVTFEITVPEKYDVIANGQLTGKQASGNREQTYYFTTRAPIPTYCAVIGICKFSITKTSTTGGLPLYYYTYPEDSLQAAYGFRHVPDMVSFYDSLIGPYPFSKLALVQSSTVYGGMENSSAIFFPENSPTYTGSGDNEETVAHEIAHQWFGDDVTEKDFSQLWLSEGFATYFSMLYLGSRHGETRFNDLLQRAKRIYQHVSKGKIPVIYTGYKDPVELLSVENYQKGALFLDSLRHYIGDEAWYKGIRLYYHKFAHKNVTTDDFRKVMESTSHKGLAPMFHQWLDKPGLPE